MATARLWRRWRRKRQATAFEDLVRDEVPYARDLARRMGASADEADDAVQESLLLLAKERSDDPVTVGLRAWICRRVVLRVKMRVRASSRRRRHELRAPRPRGVGGDPAAPLEVQDEVRAALRHLDEDERHVVVLRYLHDLDYREIAYVLGVSENACRIRVHKALKRLRGMLGERAPALIAALGLTVSSADAAIAAQAAAVVAKKGAAAVWASLTAKHVAAAGIVAAGVTTAVVVIPEAKTAPPVPPAKVARIEPSRAPIAEPPASKPTPPAPPPAVRAPSGLDALREHFAYRRDLRDLLWRDGELDALVSPRRVIRLGPGLHRMPRVAGDLWIVGAGKDETTLIGGPLVVDGAVANLRVQGVTIEGGLLRADGRVSARFEHVVVRGWSSPPVDVVGRALLSFRECAFVGGYRRPAGGRVVRVRGGVAASFLGCRFVDVDAVVDPRDTAHRRSALHFASCRFDRARLAERAPGFALRVRGARATMVGWGHPFASEREDVTVVAPPVRCRLRDLRDVALRFEDAVAIHALAWEGLVRPHFVVFRRDGSTVVVPPDPGLVLPPGPASVDGGALADILQTAWPDLDGAAAADVVSLRRGPYGLQLHVADALGKRIATYDATRDRVRR